jgi:GNAT superfamily N-acetyltransferase
MILIRTAKIKDLSELVAMCFELEKYEGKIDSYYKVGKNYKKHFFDFFKKSLYSKNMISLVAETEGKLIGFGCAQINYRPAYNIGKVGFISKLYVNKDFRRQGVAGKILKVICQWCKRNKVYNIELNVLVNNGVACKAWDKHGFKDLLLRKRKILKK